MKDRTVSRGQGCWNCTNSSHAGKWWNERRLIDLKAAVVLAQESPLGEKLPKVVQIRRMVDMLDKAVAEGAMIRCTKGVTAIGETIGDLTPHNYLCDRWCGAVGASLAREGGAPDKLPEELMEIMTFGKPKSVSEYLAEQKEKGQ